MLCVPIPAMIALTASPVKRYGGRMKTMIFQRGIFQRGIYTMIIRLLAARVTQRRHPLRREVWSSRLSVTSRVDSVAAMRGWVMHGVTL